MIAAPLTHNNPNYADEMSLCLCLVVNSNIPLFILNGTPPMRYQAEKMYVEFHISKFETIILSLSFHKRSMDRNTNTQPRDYVQMARFRLWFK